MNLSKHFTLQEAVRSATAEKNNVSNDPSVEQLENIKYTASKMEKVRKVLNNSPIIVTSWFRGEKVNSLVGGSKTSSHMSGLAVDFTAPKFGNIEKVAKALMKEKETIGYDQLILEPGWIHIGFAAEGAKSRQQELTYNGKRYLQGINV